jgi:predicted dithiol-disulfide oxidoreductase (DUF899 family)
MALSAEDRLDIQELVARAARIGDSLGWTTQPNRFSPKDWVALFTDDAEWRSSALAYVGREELLGRAEARADPSSSVFAANQQHIMSSISIEGDGDEATVYAYVMTVRANPDGQSAEIVFMGDYEDVVRKVDGKWLFSRRSMPVGNTLMVHPDLRPRERQADNPS